jgi:membrane protein DedA with SNARE-associated domain
MITLAAAAPQHLPGFLHSLEGPLNSAGYAAVFGFVLLEDFGIPVPGETILILGAVYAGAGRLSIYLVGLLAFLGAVTGDNIGFAIGHFGGRPLIERWGKYVFLTPERLDKATGFFERHGGKIVVVARFIEGLRQANGIIAGVTGMHWLKFGAFNAIGAALWVAVWTCLGYFSGNHIDSIYHGITRYSLYVLIAIGVLVVALIARAVLRRRRRNALAGEAGEAGQGADRADEPGAADAGPGAADAGPGAAETLAPDVQPAEPPAGHEP